MNYAKLQADMLRDLDKKNHGKRTPRYDYALRAESVWIVVNGQLAVAVPFRRFYLDIDKVFPDQDQVDVGRYLKASWEYDAALYTHTTKTVEVSINRKEKVAAFKVASGGPTVWVNENYLKYFDLDACEFQALNKRSPVFVYEQGEPVGFIFPVIIKEEVNE